MIGNKFVHVVPKKPVEKRSIVVRDSKRVSQHTLDPHARDLSGEDLVAAVAFFLSCKENEGREPQIVVTQKASYAVSVQLAQKVKVNKFLRIERR